MILQTGGLASGATSTRSSSATRGDAESVFDAHNAYLLATWSDQTDFRYSNALVDAGLSADGASYVVLFSRSPPPSCPHTKALHIAGPITDQDRHPRRCL